MDEVERLADRPRRAPPGRENRRCRRSRGTDRRSRRRAALGGQAGRSRVRGGLRGGSGSDPGGALGRIGGESEDAPAVESTRKGLRIGGVRPEGIGDAVDALETAEIDFESLAWSEPSLEDVYLRLTGEEYSPRSEPLDEVAPDGATDEPLRADHDRGDGGGAVVPPAADGGVFTFFFPVILVVIFGALVQTQPTGGGLFAEPAGYYIPGYLARSSCCSRRCRGSAPRSPVTATVAGSRSWRRRRSRVSSGCSRTRWSTSRSSARRACSSSDSCWR